jgi:carbonic anhydrase
MVQRFSPACFVLLLVTSCASSPTPSPEWSYEGATGPDHWSELKPEYALAKDGKRQSPIDIDVAAAVTAEQAPIEVSYDPATLEIFNNGHTIEDNYHDGGKITIDGHEYALAQFHFHSPSEHTINGAHFPMEMHLVHKDADGNLAVVGVMIAEGRTNEVFARVGHYAPTEPGRAEHVDGIEIDATELLPESLASYRYSGSLTTPPCSEDVRWLLLKTPIEASQEQITRFREIYFGNNRPTQPLHGRTVIASN